MSTYRFFRDSLIIDDTLFARLGNAGIVPAPGDTLVLGAAHCILSSLSPALNYTILADTLAPSPVVSVNAVSVPAPRVSVIANTITGPFRLVITGAPGTPGAPGNKGDDGGTVIINGKPVQLPGENGGPSQDGGPGNPGGTLLIRYGNTPTAPTAAAPGGPGGKGGTGGAGGKGKPPGKKGANGRNGAQGAVGSAIIFHAPADQVPAGLNPDFAVGWSDYRTDVGLFRRFDANNQLLALAEFNAAIELNPANTRAATLRNRVLAQQTPGGRKRRPASDNPNPQEVEFTLFPHLEAFNFQAGTNGLKAKIPAQPQSNVDPGPPFSFWGRGALADWHLFTDSSSKALNLSSLTAIRLTIGCIGLIAQGTQAPGTLQLRVQAAKEHAVGAR